ncbi:JmjC [Kalmanozyma brasiliensis GHG001]|uniref:JmjC domain-containing protein n=1 Tax=Kalmanozyma brasiliensis (strain GHG001) TaxID=1365824 RepID=V5GLP4_KALBG|nr:JmjC [Kalmanozyma brasiliensis GHG001]EST06887.1 JmjC [Kalmanozyma brasiliensis GHG001]
MFRVPPLPLHLDAYQGWRPLEADPRIVQVKSSISTADMWAHFISKRRPVIIDGHPQDADWNASRWSDLDYLSSVAGQVPVKIEPVHPAAGHFGTSVKRKKVKFAEFIDILKDSRDAGKWYLTTQYVEDGEQDQPIPSSSAKPDSDRDFESDDSDSEPELDNVLPAPTNALSNDFPSKPQLLGNLVLQQCNLWLGNSKEGKSSGLHHDFHDNLYVLLSGYKRFLLFPPSAHRYLHPRGFIDRVHHNGLIVYTPPGEIPAYVPVPGRKLRLPIRPDGLVPSDAARWRRKARLRIKQEIDERAAADAGEGSRLKSQRKGKAKQTRAQELAEEALLQAEAELRICRMDEEGIDHEADTSDDDADYDDDSNADIDDILSGLVDSNGNQLINTSEEESDDVEDDEDRADGEDDDDDQARRLLDSLPAPMKPIGLAALAGDADSVDKLRAYLESVAEPDRRDAEQSSRSEADESDEDSDGAQQTDGHSASDSRGQSRSEDEETDPDALLSPMVNGLSRKRKDLSSSEQGEDASHDGKEAEDESDTVESDHSRSPVKRVKIAFRVDDTNADELQSGLEDTASRTEQSGTPEQDSMSSEGGDEEDESDEPGFFGADSGSEFGDVDEGEAELARLLAMADENSNAQASSAADADEENEPQSFSRIPPHVLHRCLGIPDDPSRPMPRESNGAAGSRTKKTPASEPYSLPPECPLPIEVYLKPGQMLYLPASWYHEVTSSSLPPLHEQQNPDDPTEESSKVHMALNYWFHPPDALDFEPAPRQASAANGQGRTSSDVVVPGLGVSLGQSAIENLGAGTGTYERPYRDAEVWDEVAHAVAQQVQLARDNAKH